MFKNIFRPQNAANKASPRKAGKKVFTFGKGTETLEADKIKDFSLNDASIDLDRRQNAHASPTIENSDSASNSSKKTDIASQALKYVLDLTDTVDLSDSSGDDKSAGKIDEAFDGNASTSSVEVNDQEALENDNHDEEIVKAEKSEETKKKKKKKKSSMKTKGIPSGSDDRCDVEEKKSKKSKKTKPPTEDDESIGKKGKEKNATKSKKGKKEKKKKKSSKDTSGIDTTSAKGPTNCDDTEEGKTPSCTLSSATATSLDSTDTTSSNSVDNTDACSTTSTSSSSKDDSDTIICQRKKSKKTSRRDPEPTDEEVWESWKPTYKTTEQKTSGNWSSVSLGEMKVVQGKSISKAIALFNKNPKKYIALTYQDKVKNFSLKNQRYTLYYREGTQKLEPTPVREDKGETPWLTVKMHHYQHLPPFRDGELPLQYRDKYTDDMMYRGKPVHFHKPIMPGRGMDWRSDIPNLKVMGKIDPIDIRQGMEVGDCWLLSSISALAEYPGLIKHLFRKTPNLMQRPLPGPNMYTVTLWDLTSWEEVDVQIDERLALAPDGDNLLGAKISRDGSLWVPYLEKAIAMHCGGWDNIHGGRCTHAWAQMTGCKEQYTIWKRPDDDDGQLKFFCHARFNPNKRKWVPHLNNPKDGLKGAVWPTPWPDEGTVYDFEEIPAQGLLAEGLFEKLHHFYQREYLVAACTISVANTYDGGMVDEHAYTVIKVVPNAADTGVDLVRVRNPWGRGAIQEGQFDEDGPGWDKYPEITALLNPTHEDDGTFYLTKEEFFKFFETLFVSASDMSQFKE